MKFCITNQCSRPQKRRLIEALYLGDIVLTKLYREISKSCCVITVFLEDEVISIGTGFCFLTTGEILTAGHVVTGRTPIRAKDADDSDVKILVTFPNVPLLEYKVSLSCITIKVDGFDEDVQIDLAILVPAIDPPILNPIAVHTTAPELGEEVYLAGYSDELELPFQIERKINKDTEGATEFLAAMQTGYTADMTGPLIKRGIVANLRRVEASGSHSIKCDVFYVDNGMHSGASGGPVVNASGCAVGLITQRAITSASQSENPDLSVPSGSTVCISFAPLLALNNENV